MSHIELFESISAEPLYQIQEVTTELVRQVLEQARQAKKRMRQTTAQQRADVIGKVVRFQAEKCEWLVDGVARETGRRLDIMLLASLTAFAVCNAVTLKLSELI